MSVFDLEKIREDLSMYDRDMPCAMKALQILIRLCEEGQRLEAENAELWRKWRRCQNRAKLGGIPCRISMKETPLSRA